MSFIKKIIIKIIKKNASYILPKVRKIIQEELVSNSHNVKYYLQENAAKETAEFVINNIPINLHFRDRYALLSYTCNLLKESKIKKGAILEFGVWKGSTINHMAKLLPEISFFGFDSFEGLTEPWIFNDVGAFGNMKDLPKVQSNVSLIKGYFNETLPLFISKLDQDVKLIHIDCDLYSSTVTIFDNIIQLLKPRVIIVFDEFFNYPGWKNGEYKAWNECVSKYNLKFKYIGYTYQKNEQYKSGQQVAVQLY